jgi:hypothetical protein
MFILEKIYSLIYSNKILLLAFLAIHVILILIFLILNFRFFFFRFSKISKKSWVILAIIFIIGFLLRSASFNLYDFHPVHEYAIFLQKDGELINRCYFGNYDYCFEKEGSLFPPGYPFLVVIAYLLFGVKTMFASYLSAFLSSLTIILIFLICYILFKNEEIGLFSCAIFALIPISIIFSHVSETRSISIFFICSTILTYLIALKEDKIKSWILFFLLLSYTIYVRQENSILFLLFFIGMFLFNYKLDFDKIKKFIPPILLFLILQFPVQLWVIYDKTSPMWSPGTDVQIFSISYFISNLRIYIKILFNYFFNIDKDPNNMGLFNPIISFISIIGIFFIFEKKQRREKIFITSWFLLYFIFNSLYFSCYILNSFCHAHLRYILLITPAYSILAGYVLFKIRNLIKIKEIAFLFAIFLILFFTSNINIPKSLFKDDRFNYYQDLILAANKTQSDCIIITPAAEIVRSDILKDNHRETIGPQNVVNNDIFLSEASKSDCVLYFSHKQYEGQNGLEVDFIEKKFNLNYLFTEGSVEVYSLKNK